MKIKNINWRVDRGHFNWADPSEETTCIHFVVETEDEKLVVNIHLDADDYRYWTDRFRDSPVEAFEEAAREWLNRILWSSEKETVEKILSLIEQNRDQFEVWTYKYEKARLEKREKKLTEELEKVRASLAYVNEWLEECEDK